MKPIICTYCEGNDTKFGVFVKEKDRIRFIRAASVDVYTTGAKGHSAVDALQMLDEDANIQLDGSDSGFLTEEPDTPSVFEGVVNSELAGIKLQSSNFVTILTEPSVYYHVVSKKTTGNASSVTQEILSENGDLKEKKIDRDTYGKVELADGSTLTVYLRQDIPCFRMLNKLADFNRQTRSYKIVSVKSAEVSLVNFVAKKKKFFPDDYSLIVYIGKEYSKLIFMQGRKLKHIGSTLDVGTVNLHSYDVYFSKILLEMENGGIPTLDNIIVCGEDVTENLILSFYGTFPETNVSRLDYDDVDFSELHDENRSNISSFTIPIAVALEYFEEINKQYLGLNLLPAYIREEQKRFQFAWHGFVVLIALFAAAALFTYFGLQYNREMSSLNKEITIQKEQKEKNLKILSEIDNLSRRINDFDQTQSILDSVTRGTEVWGNFLGKVSNYAATKKNFWFRSLVIDETVGAKVEGHSLSKTVLTDLTAHLDSALLKSVNYDPIKDKDAYRYVLNFKVPK
ncbi:MAG: hypothetical protein LWX56_05405 [Ignavibacteria bacterium]|nr:hypothetical protein [Ignavibacteria bacterium]